jgi:S1-C subfamily serine protease
VRQNVAGIKDAGKPVDEARSRLDKSSPARLARPTRSAPSSLNQTKGGGVTVPGAPAEPTSASGVEAAAKNDGSASAFGAEKDAPAQILGLAVNQPAGPDAPAPQDVTVCSGVSLGNRLVVTFAQVPSPRISVPQFKVTLPDGQQSSADLRVVDQYSGLSLLECPKADLEGLACCDTPSKVGDTVYTAAASGIEPPVVSRGIVSGLERALTGTGLPPLLLCDLRTTETSSGAPLVNESGELVGVIIAAGASNQMANWAYAVPVQYVNRLVKAHKPDDLVVLERRRPTVGLTMRQGDKEGTVEVEHVTPQGPAEQAGIKKGDRILEAEGRKIRSAYQAVDLILSRQPGDEVEFLVEQNGAEKDVRVQLGGAPEPAAMPSGGGQNFRYGQVRVSKLAENTFEVQAGAGVQQQAAAAAPPAAVPANRPAGAADLQDVKVLREQLFRCEQSIATLQAELSSRERKLVENEQQLKSLRREVTELRRKAAEPAKPASESK